LYFFALLLLFSYLCVVVKEHADFPSPSLLSPTISLRQIVFSIKYVSFLRSWLAGRSLAYVQPAFAPCASSRQPIGSALLWRRLVGVTGFEPVTLRLSSACSNQLSYTPIKPNLACRAVARAKAGGAEGIRTPDLQLAKLPLYQLSYSPTSILSSAIFHLRFLPRNCIRRFRCYQRVRSIFT
jgi:hypothetical protein